jgi:hypothetical protein
MYTFIVIILHSNTIHAFSFATAMAMVISFYLSFLEVIFELFIHFRHQVRRRRVGDEDASARLSVGWHVAATFGLVYYLGVAYFTCLHLSESPLGAPKDVCPPQYSGLESFVNTAMVSKTSDTVDELGLYVVPDLTMKQLLDAIPYVPFDGELA